MPRSLIATPWQSGLVLICLVETLSRQRHEIFFVNQTKIVFVQSKSTLVGPRGGRGGAVSGLGRFHFSPGGGVFPRKRGAPLLQRLLTTSGGLGNSHFSILEKLCGFPPHRDDALTLNYNFFFY